MSKNRELKRTSDFSEGDKVLIGSTNTFGQRDPMVKFKAYQVFFFFKKIKNGERRHSGL